MQYIFVYYLLLALQLTFDLLFQGLLGFLIFAFLSEAFEWSYAKKVPLRIIFCQGSIYHCFQLRKFYRVFNVAPAPIIKILNHGPRVLPIPTDIPTYNGYSIHGRLRTLQSKHLQCSKPLKNGDVSNLVISREFLLVILSIFKESHRKLSFRWNICYIPI